MNIYPNNFYISRLVSDLVISLGKVKGTEIICPIKEGLAFGK